MDLTLNNTLCHNFLKSCDHVLLPTHALVAIKIFIYSFIYLFIHLFKILFNVGQTIVTRLIKTNLTKTNTDIINKNFKVFDMQHKNSESSVHDSISV